MKLVVLAPAEDELKAACDYYLEHASPRIAAALINEYELALRQLLEFPEIGPAIPNARRQRMLPLRRFPYSVIYHVAADSIVVNALAHHRRKPGYWRGRS